MNRTKKPKPQKRKAITKGATKRRRMVPAIVTKPYWFFSDGTLVILGGHIEGTSAFAQELEEELANEPQLLIGLMPSIHNIALDVNDAVHMHEWLRQKTAMPESRKPMLVEAPKDVPSVRDRWPGLYESIPGRVY